MADEELVPSGEPETVDAPAVVTEPETNDQPNPVEALAVDMGWSPKDKWNGPEEDWKPADEYIRAGHDIQKGLKRELRSVRDEVSRIARTSADMTAQALAERDAHWQRVHRQAVEIGDVELAERAVEERGKLKEAAPDTRPVEPPETAAFKERHKNWFEKDRVATMRAMQVAEASRAMGATIAEQLEDAERAVRKEFPELFKAPAKTPPGTQTGTSRNSAPSNRTRGFADMPAESQAMARDYLDRHGIPLEKTAASYWALNERKVG